MTTHQDRIEAQRLAFSLEVDDLVTQLIDQSTPGTATQEQFNALVDNYIDRNTDFEDRLNILKFFGERRHCFSDPLPDMDGYFSDIAAAMAYNAAQAEVFERWCKETGNTIME